MEHIFTLIFSNIFLLAPFVIVFICTISMVNRKDVRRKFLGLFIILPEDMTDKQKRDLGIVAVKKKKEYYGNCKPCGAQLVIGTKICEYCGTPHNLYPDNYKMAKKCHVGMSGALNTMFLDEN